MPLSAVPTHSDRFGLGVLTLVWAGAMRSFEQIYFVLINTASVGASHAPFKSALACGLSSSKCSLRLLPA